MQKQPCNQQAVTLYFADLVMLWAFVQSLECHNVEINFKSNSLTGSCSEEEVQKAFLHYKASGVRHALSDQ